MKRQALGLGLCVAISTLACKKDGPDSGEVDGRSQGPAVDALSAPLPADIVALMALRGRESLLETLRFAMPIGRMNDEEFAAFTRDLDALFTARLGLELSGISGVTLFLTEFTPSNGALVAHGAKLLTQDRQPAGEIAGAPYFTLDDLPGVFLAPLADGVVAASSPQVLEQVLQTEAGKGEAFRDSDRPLRAMLKGRERAQLIFAMDAAGVGKEAAQLEQFGLERMVLTGDAGHVFWRGEGNPAKLPALADLIQSSVQEMSQMPQGVGRPEERPLLEAIIEIFTRYQGKAYERIVQPKMVGEGLELDISVSVSSGYTSVAFLGLLGAVATPAFTKYMRRAKTSEAKVQLARISDLVATYARENQNLCPTDGRSEGKVGPTPPLDLNCNLGPGARCIPGPPLAGAGYYESRLWSEDPVWSALGFDVDQGHYYHFAFEWKNLEAGGGCQFKVSAYGDLDDDGIFSTFERAGTADASGVNFVEGLYIESETE